MLIMLIEYIFLTHKSLIFCTMDNISFLTKTKLI